MKDDDFSARMLSIYDQADDEGKCLILLAVHSIKRGDERLTQGLIAMSQMPRPATDEDECNPPDLELASRLRAVCCDLEVIGWGRAMALAYLGGDRMRADALDKLMRLRTAS